MSLSVEDRMDLYEIYTRSTRLITDKKLDQWLDLFLPDAVFFLGGAMGAPDMEVKGHEEIGPWMQQIVDGEFDHLMGVEKGSKKKYLLTNIMLEEDGEGRANGSAYFCLIIPEWEGGPRLHGTGVYTDTFVKTSDGWKIATRRLDPDVA